MKKIILSILTLSAIAFACPGSNGHYKCSCSIDQKTKCSIQKQEKQKDVKKSCNHDKKKCSYHQKEN